MNPFCWDMFRGYAPTLGLRHPLSPWRRATRTGARCRTWASPAAARHLDIWRASCSPIHLLPEARYRLEIWHQPLHHPHHLKVPVAFILELLLASTFMVSPPESLSFPVLSSFSSHRTCWIGRCIARASVSR